MHRELQEEMTSYFKKKTRLVQAAIFQSRFDKINSPGLISNSGEFHHSVYLERCSLVTTNFQSFDNVHTELVYRFISIVLFLVMFTY